MSPWHLRWPSNDHMIRRYLSSYVQHKRTQSLVFLAADRWMKRTKNCHSLELVSFVSLAKRWYGAYAYFSPSSGHTSTWSNHSRLDFDRRNLVAIFHLIECLVYSWVYVYSSLRSSLWYLLLLDYEKIEQSCILPGCLTVLSKSPSQRSSSLDFSTDQGFCQLVLELGLLVSDRLTISRVLFNLVCCPGQY